LSETTCTILVFCVPALPKVFVDEQYGLVPRLSATWRRFRRLRFSINLYVAPEGQECTSTSKAAKSLQSSGTSTIIVSPSPQWARRSAGAYRIPDGEGDEEAQLQRQHPRLGREDDDPGWPLPSRRNSDNSGGGDVSLVNLAPLEKTTNLKACKCLRRAGSQGDEVELMKPPSGGFVVNVMHEFERQSKTSVSESGESRMVSERQHPWMQH